ncbi:MAG: toxic anion resistance protein [Pseudomonadales bacterium]|nr:toxic anion resistance protein [Pseudomonadales bacterium]
MQVTLTDKPKVKTKDVIASELKLEQPEQTSDLADIKPEIAKQAQEIFDKLINTNPENLTELNQFSKAVRNIGQPIQSQLVKQSQLLKEPMAVLANDIEDGSAVANNLFSLQQQVNEINPNRIDFSMSAFRRLLAKIPGVGTPMARWFTKYQSVGSVINDIVRNLKNGRSQLERDCITLEDDQIRMRELIFKLRDYITLASALDQKLEKAVNNSSISEPHLKRFIEAELIFPLKQRILDLQQQMAVIQQSVLATEVIIRNNRELITGVNRALNVTVTALNTAASVKIALQHQKNVLKGIEAVTNTTDDLISGTADQLKKQGLEIQQRTVNAQLDIENLNKAFKEVEAALEDISQFRRDALPQMAQSIVDMNDISSEMKNSIEKLGDDHTSPSTHDTIFKL